MPLTLGVAVTATPALAQDTRTGTTDTYDAGDRRDDGFPWGLLGLAGLLPRKRPDDHRTTPRTNA